jgi:hypothetical protein
MSALVGVRCEGAGKCRTSTFIPSLTETSFPSLEGVSSSPVPAFETSLFRGGIVGVLCVAAVNQLLEFRSKSSSFHRVALSGAHVISLTVIVDI